jgi:fatty-acyl-CoA synthase
MAECSLAVSFAPLETGASSDLVDIDRLAHHGEAIAMPAEGTASKGKAFINCGQPLPGYEMEIRDERGRPLPERRCGRIHLRGPSLMSGYFGNPEASREVLSADGWLDTGDIGYQANGSLYITGRAKDLMIIKGRNIWPQDLEHLAEQEPEVRPTDASAFSITDDDGSETAVLVVQCREADPRKLASLAERVQQAIHVEFGIHCVIELVPPHTLPRTSSGKLSRSTARKEFIERRSAEEPTESRGRFVGHARRAAIEAESAAS